MCCRRWKGTFVNFLQLRLAASFCFLNLLHRYPNYFVGGHPNQRAMKWWMVMLFIPGGFWRVDGPSSRGLYVHCNCLSIWYARMSSSRIIGPQRAKFPEIEMSPFCPSTESGHSIGSINLQSSICSFAYDLIWWLIPPLTPEAWLFKIRYDHSTSTRSCMARATPVGIMFPHPHSKLANMSNTWHSDGETYEQSSKFDAKIHFEFRPLA